MEIMIIGVEIANEIFMTFQVVLLRLSLIPLNKGNISVITDDGIAKINIIIA